MGPLLLRKDGLRGLQAHLVEAVGFGEDRESIFQVVRVRRKVVGPLVDSWRIWRSTAALFCAFGGSKEAWGAWISS